MSAYHVLIFRVVITLIAGSFVIFIARWLLRSMFRGGRRFLGVIVRFAAFVLCAWIVSLAGRGDIGSWGAWVGLGGATVVTMLSFFA